MGIRVLSGETVGFAHTADLSEAGLLEAARVASAVARGGGGGTTVVALEGLRRHEVRATKLHDSAIQ